MSAHIRMLFSFIEYYPVVDLCANYSFKRLTKLN